jgi:medium-chain acyl-[acyl-carrier-protein] hydrolase
MKVTLTRKIDYADVGTDFNQNLGAFFKLIQEAAVLHSERVGYDTQTLLDRGEVWILNALEAEIYRYPRLREEISVVTWHRKSKGFKAFRDFRVQAGEETLASASSLWLYFDIRKKRLTRVPAETGEVYTSEGDKALESTIETWTPRGDFTPEFETELGVRHSDFDPLNHVNNAVYLDYLETLVARSGDHRKKIKGLKIQYKKEIDRTVTTLKAGLQPTDSGCCFKLYDEKHLFAAGEMDLAEQGKR